VKVSVPGKAVLLGEYAVTDGGRALVTAVSCRAWAEAVEATRAEPDSPVVRAVRRVVLDEPAAPGRDLGIFIDTSSFRDAQGAKYGFGSSSAAAVCAAALLLEATDERVLRAAVLGHRAANEGRGSGIDVAACFAGGVSSIARQPGAIEAMPHRLPGYELAFFRLGPPVSTADFVKRCRRSSDWPRWARELREHTEEGLDAYAAREAPRFLSAVDRFVDALDGLGRSADVPIVTPEAHALRAAAKAAGGAAKPSGAGGGDIAIAWLPSEVNVEVLAAEAGIEALSARVDPAGLLRETPR